MALPAMIAERWEIKGLVGSGGMGRVYQAQDLVTGRLVALKVLRRRSPHERERFAREASVLARLTHPAIVRYVGHGTTDDDDPYLVMEWVEGETLGKRLERQGLTAAESVAVVRRVAGAVGELHGLGLVHRDVNPYNILFPPGGDPENVKLIDFGIVREPASGLTRTGTAIGTVGYMAPEQARGRRDLDARADVFALGCVLFECLTARPLFRGGSLIAVQTRILFEDAPPLAGLWPQAPEDLRSLVAAMLSKDPVLRPPDAGAVAGALEALGPIPDTPRRPLILPGPPRIPATEAATEPAPLVSLIVTAFVDPAELTGAPTVDVDAIDERARAVAAAVAPFAGEPETLSDGTVVVRLTGRDDATTHAVRAARCALAIRGVVTGAPIVLVSGRGELSIGQLDEVVTKGARGAAVMAAVRRRTPPATEPDAILVDSLTAGLLDGRFRLRTTRTGHYLLGELA